MKLAKPCKKCFTEKNRGRTNCYECGFKLEQATFEESLLHSEQSRQENLSEREIDKNKQAEEQKLKIEKRKSAKLAMNEKELATFELLEEILEVLKNSGKFGFSGNVNKAMLNAAATSAVENFLNND